MSQRKNAPEPVKVVVTFTGDLAVGLVHEAHALMCSYPDVLRDALRYWLDRENNAQRMPLSFGEKVTR